MAVVESGGGEGMEEGFSVIEVRMRDNAEVEEGSFENVMLKSTSVQNNWSNNEFLVIQLGVNAV